MNIRPFNDSDADYEATVAIANTVWKDYPGTVDEWKHDDKVRDRKYWFHRCVAMLDDRMVGFATTGDVRWAHKPGKYYINMVVLPDYRRRGVGTALFDYCMAQIGEQPEPLRLLEGHTRVTDHPLKDGGRDFDVRGLLEIYR